MAKRQRLDEAAIYQKDVWINNILPRVGVHDLVRLAKTSSRLRDYVSEFASRGLDALDGDTAVMFRSLDRWLPGFRASSELDAYAAAVCFMRQSFYEEFASVVARHYNEEKEAALRLWRAPGRKRLPACVVDNLIGRPEFMRMLGDARADPRRVRDDFAAAVYAAIESVQFVCGRLPAHSSTAAAGAPPPPPRFVVYNKRDDLLLVVVPGAPGACLQHNGMHGASEALRVLLQGGDPKRLLPEPVDGGGGGSRVHVCYRTRTGSLRIMDDDQCFLLDIAQHTGAAAAADYSGGLRFVDCSFPLESALHRSYDKPAFFDAQERLFSAWRACDCDVFRIVGLRAECTYGKPVMCFYAKRTAPHTHKIYYIMAHVRTDVESWRSGRACRKASAYDVANKKFYVVRESTTFAGAPLAVGHASASSRRDLTFESQAIVDHLSYLIWSRRSGSRHDRVDERSDAWPRIFKDRLAFDMLKRITDLMDQCIRCDGPTFFRSRHASGACGFSGMPPSSSSSSSSCGDDDDDDSE